MNSNLSCKMKRIGHWNLVRLDDVPAQPWKNGGGVTRQLLAWPENDNWRLRISVADIAQDGPFSRFEGVQRWFAVLEGSGVWLKIAGITHRLTQTSAPLSFEGVLPADCALMDGPTRDFNGMVRGGLGQMHRIEGSMVKTMDCAKLVACYGHQSGARIQTNKVDINLAPETLAWCQFDHGDVVEILTSNALWMEIPC